ncbi:hypothetical protein ACFW04_002516 [Cataglyphis niger]
MFLDFIRKNYLNLITSKKIDADISSFQCCTTTMTYTKKPGMIKSGLFNFQTDIILSAVLKVALLHSIGIYGIFTFNYLKNPMTTLWKITLHTLNIFFHIFKYVFLIGMYIISTFGISGGAHRFWTHKCFKAKLPLRILLLISRIFFSHIGWIMMKEHPEFIEKSKQIDLSDVLSDPVVVFGEKYCLPLQLLFGFVLPTIIPVYFWNDSWGRAIISQVFIRYMISLHSMWTINSIAHAWGTRPYNKNIKPADNNIVNYLTLGEGYHNYHHVFPWDYRSAEIGNTKMNYTTFFIEMFAKLGLAYDLKYPSANLIKKTALKISDRTHHILSEVSGSKSD